MFVLLFVWHLNVDKKVNARFLKLFSFLTAFFKSQFPKIFDLDQFEKNHMTEKPQKNFA